MSQSVLSNKQSVLKLYFTLRRGVYILSALLALSFLISVFDWFVLFTSLSGMFFIAVQFYGSIVAQKRLKASEHIGLYLALVLNTFILCSLFFPVALFGYYALLNAEMRAKFPKDQNPEWLNNCFEYIEDFERSVKKTA